MAGHPVELNRRKVLPLVVSVAAHLAVVVAVLARATPVASPTEPVAIEIKSIPGREWVPRRLSEMEAVGRAAPTRVKHERMRRPPAVLDSHSGKGGGRSTPEPGLDAGAAKGPCVAMVVRLDRLHGTPNHERVAALLNHLPDRGGALHSGGLDLLSNVDEVVIAAANMDDASQMLVAARHRMEPTALRSQLEQEAEATGQTIVWRQEAGHVVGQRFSQLDGGELPSRGAARSTILLYDDGLMVVPPSAYEAGQARPDAAQIDAVADGGAWSGADGGVEWSTLLVAVQDLERRLPADAAIMLESNTVLINRDDIASGGVPTDAPGLPVLVHAQVGAGSALRIDVDSEFASELDARWWEQAWPEIARHICAGVQPTSALGLAPLLGRARLARTGTNLHLVLALKDDETRWLLGVAVEALVRRGT